MHYHNRIYKPSELDFSLCPHIVGTAAAIIIGTTIAAGAVVGTSMYGAAQEKKAQKKTLDFQQEQVSKAEAAAKGAEALATETATETLKKRRLARTQTILTRPLGILEEATTGKTFLLGG